MEIYGANKISVVDIVKTLFATKDPNGLGLIRIVKFWTALKISWFSRFNYSRSFGIFIKWLLKLDCPSKD